MRLSHRGAASAKGSHDSTIFKLHDYGGGVIFQGMTWLNSGHDEGTAVAYRYGERLAEGSVRIQRQPLPGDELETNKMPGHWLLARLGKRVLRPGGLELTRRLIERLDIRPSDSVVEFAPGLGVTARLALSQHPSSYTAVERDETAARNLRALLEAPHQACVCGSADQTGLPSGIASVVYGEAMLTMQGPAQKARIMREAFRLLKPGGRYGIHELCFTPDDLDEQIKREVQSKLTESIRVGARPLTVAEWRVLLEEEGFEVRHESVAPMHLLEPSRLLRDEGFLGAGRFIWNVLRDSDARARVRTMRDVFRKYEANMAAIMLVAYKALESSPKQDLQ
jgi:SAM-dependent methyltransferase